MFRKMLAICICLACPVSLAVAADIPASQGKLTAAQIVEKNVAARGGLQAWRSVQTLSLSGKMDVGSKTRPTLPEPTHKGAKPAAHPAAPEPEVQVQLPIVFEFKRSHKSRVELQFKGQTAIQAYDGTNGWKLRPYLNRHEVELYTPEELKSASRQAELDGPLVDYAAKGSKVELVGTEKVGDRDTYKLAVTTRDGQVRHIWLDATNYLEVKVEGNPRRLDGEYRPVEIYYEDFRSVPGGIVVPYVLETRVVGNKRSEKIQIESVQVNPPLDDSLFAKPK